MKVQYFPKKWRPDPVLDATIRTVFTLLHVVEPIENLTLTIADARYIRIKGKPDGTILAAFCEEDNEIILPIRGEFTMFKLLHEYQHAVDFRNGIDTKNHRGFPQKMEKLLRKLQRET